MGDQNIPAKRYTVGALLLQAVVLLAYAALAYLDSLASSDPFIFAGSRTLAIYNGVLGLIAIWLTGEHYTESVRSSRLQLWVIFCIILSLFPLIAYGSMFILYHTALSLVFLLPALLFIVPTIMVLHFSRKEFSQSKM